ncbi:MAG TPA: hypothetical protein VK698_11530 [Kofleriaceae bacterium]|nr:hypothetical protein [Kofleriaceae bacterium]
MNNMIFASSLIHRTSPTRLDDLYAGPWTGLKDALRIAAALGALATYAGLLALVGS